MPWTFIYEESEKKNRVRNQRSYILWIIFQFRHCCDQMAQFFTSIIARSQIVCTVRKSMCKMSKFLSSFLMYVLAWQSIIKTLFYYSWFFIGLLALWSLSINQPTDLQMAGVFTQQGKSNCLIFKGLLSF